MPVTLALRQLIERSFPEEYEARRQEERGIEHSGDAQEAPLALFIMSCIFPSESCLPSESSREPPLSPRKTQEWSARVQTSACGSISLSRGTGS